MTLLDRIIAAEGPTRELFEEAFVAIHGPKPPRVNGGSQEWINWLKDRGGSAAIAATRTGGRQYLAQGEVGPFAPSTISQLTILGLVEKRDGRIWVKP